MRHRRPDQPTGVRVGGTNFGQGRRGGGRAHRQVREDERAKEPKAANGSWEAQRAETGLSKGSRQQLATLLEGQETGKDPRD